MQAWIPGLVCHSQALEPWLYHCSLAHLLPYLLLPFKWSKVVNSRNLMKSNGKPLGRKHPGVSLWWLR